MKRQLWAAAVVVLGLGLAAGVYGWQRRGGGGGGYRGAAVGPRGGVATGGGGYRTVHGPYGAAAGGARGGTYTTPGGTTIRHGAAGGAAVGPGGRVAAGGARATQVTTPGGRTMTTGSRGGVAAGPRGAVAGGSRVGVAAGPGGVAVGGARGAGFATDAGLGRYAMRGGAVGAAYSTRYLSRPAVTAQAGYVRRGWVHTSVFTPTWYRSYPVAWRAPRWVAAGVWAAPAYAAVAAYCPLPPAPIYYDYGSNVVLSEGGVFVDGKAGGTAEQFAQEAVTLADAGRAAQADDADAWQPLGVFALVQGDEKTSNRIFQLAVNKAGLLRGNYYDSLGDTVAPVAGKVNGQTGRAAWSVGKRTDTVYEAGIANLTRAEAPVLVHFGKERTQQWLLVRLEEPREEK